MLKDGATPEERSGRLKGICEVRQRKVLQRRRPPCPGGMRRQRVKTLASIGNAMAMWVVSRSTAAGSGMK
jgi:hypothetical protein